MFKKIILPVAAVGLLAMTSCSGKLGALSSNNFNVVPDPMETEGGYVPVTINGTFPEKYMNKKAVVSVIPELHASDGSILRGVASTFQGEKVMGNDQIVSYVLGGHYTMRVAFPYADTYHKSDLYLSFDAKVGKKQVNVPSVKVASGVIATSELYRQAIAQSGGCIAPDTFQYARQARQVANVKFLINQAQLRKSELKNNSVQEFLRMLREINNDKSKYNLQNVEVDAYASPDGGEKLNSRIASERQANSQFYVREQMKRLNVDSRIDAKYTAQDWEGFQQLVAASNIQDKDVILRVLSMYKDPEEREEQIKNMSSGFRELADGILPELRRSRLIINYETLGRTDEQILATYKENAGALSVDELLYAATLEGVDAAKAEEIYKKTTNLFPNDYRAYNNIAVMEIKKGDAATAKEYIDKALAVNPEAKEPQANLGMLALAAGNVNKAGDFIAQAQGGNDYDFALGALNIAKGKFAAAAENLKGQNNNMAALASILNKDYESARVIFKQIGKNGDGITDYLHAIMSARQGNSYAANTYLKDAIAKNPKLAYFAEDDLEFANVK